MKNQFLAVFLALFLGSFGTHHFYLGNTRKGIYYLAFCWTFIPAFLGFLDAVKILNTPSHEFENQYNGTNLKAGKPISNKEVLRRGFIRAMVKNLFRI